MCAKKFRDNIVKIRNNPVETKRECVRGISPKILLGKASPLHPALRSHPLDPVELNLEVPGVEAGN